MRHRLAHWKQPFILLLSVSFASVGDFIYLVTINILVYKMTHSAAAVAGLWMIGPTVNVLTKFWTGSYIDYRSKRKIMIATYVSRVLVIFSIPFSPNVWFLYVLLICLSVAKSFFIPSSMTYTTQLIPKMLRKRYNSIQALTTSGAFIIGPAIGGTLILMTNVHTTLWINSGLFILSAFLLFFLPDLETSDQQPPHLSFTQIKEDWTIALSFMKENYYVAFIYSAFLATTVFSFALDAQEIVFTQRVIGLSEIQYSLLISITGIGSITGTFILSIISHKLSLRLMISIGIIMQTIGYLVYSFSWSFVSIAFGFTILGFFIVFLNAGMTTFYQNNVPAQLMGRVTSIFQLIQSLLQIVFVLTVGAIGDLIPLRVTIMALALGMLTVAIMIVFNVFQPLKKSYFRESHHA